MKKSLSPTRADRLLETFYSNALAVREVGGTRQVIEDRDFSGDSMILDGHKLANFGLCSYLGLGEDERVRQASHDAIDHYGTSYSSSVAYQAIPLYTDLKERFEKIFDANVVIAPTTTLAHFSALPILIRPGDAAFVDAQAHASVLSATQILQASGIGVHQLHHGDLEALETVLEADEGEGKIWYLVDGVYSMHGDVADAAALIDLLNKYPRLHVYADDAHGFGWAGKHGRGQHLEIGGWHDRLVVIVGLAKSFGSMGGVIATQSEEITELIELCGPPLTFGGPIPPASLGASIASADIHLSHELPDLQAQLMSRIDFVNSFTTELGLEVTDRVRTPLWFFEVGNLKETMALFSGMRDSGFYLNVAGFPAVPMRHSGLRFTVTNKNSMSQIEEMLITLNEKRLEMFGETEIEIEVDHSAEITVDES